MNLISGGSYPPEILALTFMESTKDLLTRKIDDGSFVDWLCQREGDFKFVVYQGMEAMNADIENLELTPRSYNCLKRAGYDTINSVVEDVESRKDFLKVRNMGRKSANEVMLKLFLYTYDNLKPEKRKSYLDKVKGLN